MKKLSRLLMASTVLSGLTSLGMAHAAGNPTLMDDIRERPVVLAQNDGDKARERQQQQRQERRQDRQDQRQENRNSSPPAAARDQQQKNTRQSQQQDQQKQDQQKKQSQQKQEQQGQQRQDQQKPGQQQSQQRQDQQKQGQQQDQQRQGQQKPGQQQGQQRQDQQKPGQQQGQQRQDQQKPGQQQGQQRQDQQKPGQQQGQQRQDQQKPGQQQGQQRQDQQKQGQQEGQQGRDRSTPAATDQRNNQGRDTDRAQQGRERERDQTRDRDNRNQPAAGDAARGGRDADPVTRSGNRMPAADDKPIRSEGAGRGVAVRAPDGKEIRRVDQLRNERREVKEGNRTIIREPDRTIIKEGNRTIIRHDEVSRFRVGARDVRVERRGNENRTIIVRPGGEQIVTVVDRNGNLLRRSRILPNGREVIIINNRPRVAGVGFFVALPPPVIRIPRERYIVAYRAAPPALIYDTLMAPPVERIERPYTLDEIRYSPAVRDRMPRIDLDTIAFDTGSWELPPDQIEKLAPIADGMKRAIEKDQQTVFLVEGHTDAVGNEDDNLSLSDRRAESVAVALTEQFGVPAENLTTQGYGEQQPIEQTDGPSQANRRVSVRNIGPLMASGDTAGAQQDEQPPQGEPVPQ